MAASGLKGRLDVENASEYRVKVERLENGVMAEVIDYKVNPNGSFHIVLDKGDYKVSVRQNGRTASDIQNVSVGESLLTFEPKL